jgi:nucleoside-diphosphate-sugar epimerase
MFKNGSVIRNLKFYEGRRVLVTGGAGFIGSHLVRSLVDAGCEVHVADNLSRGSLENLRGVIDKIHFHHLDLTKFENCLSATRDMEYVFHLAASVGGIHYIGRENVRCFTPDILMHAYMLEAARINDVERFLFTSSACIYREKNKSLNIFREEDAYPANPATTYGWTKIMGEILCRSYYLDYGIKCSVVRIFNAYGENENLDPRWSHVIPSLIRKAILYPKERFIVFGDGKQERAFLYVKDCVEGLILAMQKIENADPINLGSEEVVSISTLAQKIVALSGKNIKIEYDLSGPKGTYRYCADTSKMKKVLVWNPKTPLDEGIKRTYKWAENKLLGSG